MRDWIAACALLVAVAACGSNLGPGATPKETIRNFELALKSLDVGATYDMLSSKQRRQFDQMMTALKGSLAMVPEGMLKEAGLDGLSDLTPREFMVKVIKEAKKRAPEALDQVKNIQMVVLDVKDYGDNASVKVSTIFQGNEVTSVVPLVKEDGLWYIDSNETMSSIPIDIPDFAAAAAPG